MGQPERRSEFKRYGRRNQVRSVTWMIRRTRETAGNLYQLGAWLNLRVRELSTRNWIVWNEYYHATGTGKQPVLVNGKVNTGNTMAR
ncbi:MAG: hypothetical protein ACLU4N_15260 [Butyricimonas faecihominis]